MPASRPIIAIFASAIIFSGFATIENSGMTSFVTSASAAQLGSHFSRHYGSRKYKKHSHRSFNKRVQRSKYRNVNRRNFRNSGVILGGKTSNRLFIARKRDIQRKNYRVFLENQAQSIRRSNSVLANSRSGVSRGLVLDPREGVLTGEFNDNGTAGPVYAGTQPCPSQYNCGYRVYEDGTGPRIITPGIPAGKGLPDFDGISGPSIITPYD